MGGVPDAALARMLNQLQKDPIEGAPSRQTISRAAMAEYTGDMELVIDLPLQKAPWSWQWHVCKPATLIERSCQVSPTLRRLFATCVNSNPENPWGLILGHDEITPGNLLRPDNARKFTSFYVSFKEFGSRALRHEESWFLVGILRTKALEHVVGGFSCALRQLLRALFMDAGGLSHGIVLPLDAGPTMLFAKFSVHLGDEAALTTALCAKGASGIRCCLKCANIVKRGSDLADKNPHLCEITCMDPQRFIRCTDRDLWTMHDRLEAMQDTVGVTQFENHQKAFGLVLNKNGVLADRTLRTQVLPITSMFYDWQHTFLSNGVASQEIFYLLDACKAGGCRNVWTMLSELCQASWSFTCDHRARGVAIHRIFSPSREKASADHWKSGASELLTVYPLVRRFAESIVLVKYPHLRREVGSFVSCCKLLDMLQDTKGEAEVLDTTALQQACKSYLQLHIATYGEDGVKPKHHFAFHIGEQAQQLKMLLDCFVIERSHQLPKLVATSIKQTASFEKSVIARSVLLRLKKLEDFDIQDGLRGPSATYPELAIAIGEPDVRVAGAAMAFGVSLGSGDMARIGNHMLKFKAAISAGGYLGVLGYAGDVVERLSTTAVVYKMQATLSLLWLHGDRIRPCHAWDALGNGNVLALVPDIE